MAPALNLTTVSPAPGAGPRWRQFLRLGLAGAIAKVTDVLELQAQSLEWSPSTYAEFVRKAAAQARAANPRVAILAGLSTNPPGSGGHQPAAGRRDPRHPRDRGRLLAQHPGPRAALPDL